MSEAAPPEVTFWGRSVTIACTDRRRSERFYAQVLGATPLPGDGHGCPWYRLGELTISLMPNAEHPSPARFPDHAMPMLWLTVDDLQAAHRRLRDAGCTIVQAPDDDLMMLVADPDGLIIEIWARESSLS